MVRCVVYDAILPASVAHQLGTRSRSPLPRRAFRTGCTVAAAKPPPILPEGSRAPGRGEGRLAPAWGAWRSTGAQPISPRPSDVSWTLTSAPDVASMRRWASRLRYRGFGRVLQRIRRSRRTESVLAIEVVVLRHEVTRRSRRTIGIPIAPSSVWSILKARGVEPLPTRSDRTQVPRSRWSTSDQRPSALPMGGLDSCPGFGASY